MLHIAVSLIVEPFRVSFITSSLLACVVYFLTNVLSEITWLHEDSRTISAKNSAKTKQKQAERRGLIQVSVVLLTHLLFSFFL